MSSYYCTMLPKFTDLLSDQFLYKELVNSERLTKDDSNDFDENIYDLNELEEVFADHLLMGKRLQKSLYGGNLEENDAGNNDDCEHPPIALTDLALKLFSRAVPNYGLDLLDMDYVSSVTEATRVSPCAMILALIYLERLKLKNSDYLESVSPTGLFVVTMLVASKFLFEHEDNIVTNQIWADVLNRDVKEINRIEKKFLSAIDWRLYVDSSKFFQYLSIIETKIALKQFSLRGWLSYSDAYSIFQDAAIRKFLLSCIERIIKVSVLSALGYVVTVLSIYAAGFAIHYKYIKHVCPSSEENVNMNSIIQLQRSIPEISNIELNSGSELTVEKSDDIESAWRKLPVNNRQSYTYEIKDLSYVLHGKKIQNLSYNLEKYSAMICNSASSSSSSSSSFFWPPQKSLLNLSNSSFQHGIVFNHSHYRLYFWSSSVKNTCISVLLK